MTHNAAQYDARASHASDAQDDSVQAKVRAAFDAQSLLGMIRETVEALVAPIRGQLETANQLAVDAERGLEELTADLAVARVAESVASERAKAATSEIAEMRRLLDVADRRIEGERVRAQQEGELRAREREHVDAERDRANEAERQLAAAVGAKQELRRQVDMLSELLTQNRREAERSWWRRVFG